MLSTTTRARLARLHRWLALALSPVIAVILLSGIVLAFRPIVGDTDGPAPTASRVNVRRVIALVDSLDPQGTARVMFLDPSRRTMALASGPGSMSFHDIATGHVAAAPEEARRAPGVFDVAERIHKGGWLAGGALVTLASIAMVVLVILGPILARPGRGRTALSWHIRAGWFLWPLVALLPLSLVMMKLHLPVRSDFSAPPLSFAEALTTASRSLDVSRLVAVQRLPGAAFLVVEGADGPERYVVRQRAVRRMDSSISTLGRALHEGTWAGRWSGLLNALAGVVSLVMLGTGILSWMRRRQSATARTTRANRVAA